MLKAEIYKSQLRTENLMDIWKRMYEKVKEHFYLEGREELPFIYVHNVVCAI